MKPSSEQYDPGLPSPLNYAAKQSGQTTHPSGKETGLDVNHQQQVSPEGKGENFFLDILFHRVSDNACSRTRRSVCRCLLGRRSQPVVQSTRAVHRRVPVPQRHHALILPGGDSADRVRVASQEARNTLAPMAANLPFTASTWRELQANLFPLIVRFRTETINCGQPWQN
jgi:hypothetical protein